jgi:pimeloyl-ACP methyl ester carboxylesterase
VLSVSSGLSRSEDMTDVSLAGHRFVRGLPQRMQHDRELFAMPQLTVRDKQMHYIDAGEGPLLVILPGNTSSSAMHTREIELFSQNTRVICPDYLGTGKSDRLDPWPDDWWFRNTEDVAELIRHLDAGPAILVGSSGGGIVALGLTILNPDLVRGVIAESCAETYPPERLREMVAERTNPSKELVMFWNVAHGSDWEYVVAQDTAMMSRLADTGGRDFYEGRLGEIACPVLLAGSLLDTTVPEIDVQLPRMAKQIPNAELFMVNKGAHPLMWTAPVEFFTAAQSFLIRLLGSSRS